MNERKAAELVETCSVPPPDGTSADVTHDCPACETRFEQAEVRYLVAVSMGADLGLVDNPRLRDALVVDMAGRLCETARDLGAAADPTVFFARYRANVEQSADPAAVDFQEQRRRLWAKHARTLVAA